MSRHHSPLAGALCCATLALVSSAASAGARALYTNIATSPTSLVPGGAGLRFGLGTASQFDRPYVSGNGRYFIFTALAEVATTTDDELIIVGQLGPGGTISTAALAAREGVTTLEPARTIDSASIGRNAAINDAGEFIFQANLSGGTTDDEVLARGAVGSSSLSIALREGQAAASIGAGALYGATIDAPGINNAGKVSFRSTLTGVPTGQTTAVFLDDGATVGAQTGVTIPGGLAGGPFTWQNLGSEDFYVSADGSQWLVAGDTNGATTADGVIARNNTVAIQEGQLLPGSSSASTVTGAFGEAVMSPSGSWMARGSFADTLDWVAFNGASVAMTSDTVPGGLPGETFSQAIFTATFFAIASNGAGDYVYGGTTSNPDPEFDAVLVYNDSLVIARQGDPVDIDGNGLFDDNAFIDVFNNDDMFLTDDGYLYFFADLRDSASNTIGQAFLSLQIPAPGAATLMALASCPLLRRRR